MTDKKSSESRRKLLKSIAAGSGAIVAGKSLPDSWSRPVVDTVLLPAHAQTSNNGPFAGGATTQVPVLDSLIPQAHAGEAFTPYVCVEPNAALTHATVKLLVDSHGATLYTFNSVPVGGSSCDQDGERPCDESNAGDLLNSLGLIKDAQASEEICCFLDSVTGVGAGRIEFSGHPTVEFSVGQDPCNMLDVCDPPAESDIRLKTNIEALSISRKGYNLYQFQYIDENNENTYVGVMAQDIIARNPEAVIQNESGFYMVRYAQLGLKMVSLEQWKSEGPDSVELMH